MAICAKATISSDISIPLTCTTGVIQIDQIAQKTKESIFDVGIIPRSSQVNTYCTNRIIEDENKCSDYLNKDKLRERINRDCVGKSKCNLQDIPSYIEDGMPGFNA